MKPARKKRTGACCSKQYAYYTNPNNHNVQLRECGIKSPHSQYVKCSSLLLAYPSLQAHAVQASILEFLTVHFGATSTAQFLPDFIGETLQKQKNVLKIVHCGVMLLLVHRGSDRHRHDLQFACFYRTLVSRVCLDCLISKYALDFVAFDIAAFFVTPRSSPSRFA